MTRETEVFEMMKAIAPVFTQRGLELMERIVNAGGNPENCTVGGLSIMDAQAQSAREWAEAFVNAL